MEIMDVEEDTLHKPSSLQRRLRLRKDYKESTDNKTYPFDKSNNGSRKIDAACTSESACDDESIIDFKSPKKKHSIQPKILNSRLSDKSKKKMLRSKTKATKNDRKHESSKSLQNKKVHDIHQPLIESSFFKSEKNETDSLQSSTDTKTAYVCPLCFKNFKDEDSQAIHAKSCAIKNNVSTKKLMDAMELQERQAAERKSLGLLSAPILQDKKKPVPRKMASHNDPDFQLALALSKSLYEKEMEEWDEVQIVAMSSGSSLPDNSIEHFQKATLQSFGFTSNRNASPTSNWPTSKTKRKKPLEPTTLQRRTAAERERILTERIAEILMDCKDFTQRSQEDGEQSNNIKEKIVIKNHFLQKLHQTENTLWDRTRLTPTKNAFYVKQLSPQITPLEKKEQKLKVTEIEEQNDTMDTDTNVNDEESLDSKQMQEIKEIQAIEAPDNNEELTSFSNADKTCCKEKKFLDSLAMSWRSILNDSSASDIIVFVRNDRHIWAHKLVFYVRCTNILLDVSSNDTEYTAAKEKICWINVDYDVALVFLEFVYCGLINGQSKVLDSHTLSGVRALARKYKVNDLFIYLRQLEFKSNTAQVEYSTRSKSTENIYANVEKASNISKLERSTSNTSPNHIRDDVENIQWPQKTLQKGVNSNLHSPEDNYLSAKDPRILQEEKTDSMKLSEKIHSGSNTPANCASPDMFDDTPDVMKRNDKSATAHSRDDEDSNIHVLLSLIKQDSDADICSQRSLPGKTRSAEDSKPGKAVPTCLKHVEQNVIEIDSDSELNSLNSIENTHKYSFIDTPQSSKPKSTQNCSSKQKSDLTLFIEKIQEENAKSVSDLDSDIECPVKISSVMQNNPFLIDRHVDSKNSQFYNDNIEQLPDREKKLGKLSLIEQRMRSYAEKNPEFYSRLSNECMTSVKHDASHMISTSPERTVESFHNDVSNCAQNFTLPSDKDVNISKVATAPLSPETKATNQSLSKTIINLETDEEDISMYSKYMRDHKDKDNSIAKYRAAIGRNESDDNKSTSSDSVDENCDINETENNEVLTQSVLTQKDADIIVSSDTEIESVSSNVSCPIVLQKDDSDYENNIIHSAQQFIARTDNNEQDIGNEKNNKSLEVEIPEFITELEEEKDINDATKSNRDEFNTSDVEITSDDIDFNAIFTQKESRSDEPSDNQGEESTPIMVSSSPDFLNVESSPSGVGKCNKNVSETDKSRKFSLNFEDDIYLANVNVDRYEKYNALEKSQSASILNLTEFKKDSSRRCSNKNNRETNKRTDTMDDVLLDCENSDYNTMPLTQNFTSIRTFKKKSLSEGQINVNKLRNQETASRHISVQLQCNYNKNIGNTKIASKILEKDVTPPPDYNGMSTPELNKKMKRFGLKAQKRSRAVKLLTHIYNELHPLVPIPEITEQGVTEVLSDEDEGPPPKRSNVDDNSLEKSNSDNDDELLCSQDSNDSVRDRTRKEMEFYETESLPALGNSSDIAEAFTKLIDVDKMLHNKILRYEPVNIETLHSTLRTHGFKCKLSNLMSFLDEQCITFYAPEQNAKRTRKKA